MIDIPCNFVGSFKVGDNLRYNCKLLCDLVESNQNHAFNKMIVLQAGAVLEAALTQIIFRAQNFNLEGVPQISEKDRLVIEQKKIDKFAATIDILKKYHVLDPISGQVYDDLHRLRKFRNKIHIQTKVEIDGADQDEAKLFSNELVDWSLDLNRNVLHYLSDSLARPVHIHDYVGSLTIPG